MSRFGKCINDSGSIITHIDPVPLIHFPPNNNKSERIVTYPNLLLLGQIVLPLNNIAETPICSYFTKQDDNTMVLNMSRDIFNF